MAAILADDIFYCIFLNENDWILIQISLKFVPECPIDSICSDNGLVSNRGQAITWTNAYSVQWRIYAALLGGDELKGLLPGSPC